MFAFVCCVSTRQVCIYEALRDSNILDESLFPALLLANPQPQILTSFAVSLLLSARTSQSYDRCACHVHDLTLEQWDWIRREGGTACLQTYWFNRCVWRMLRV